MITVKLEGLDAVKRAIAQNAKQAAYAASRALNTTAFAVNADLKKEMDATFKGGATAFAKRAFKVDKSTKQNLTAIVGLRTDAPEGGTSYYKALHHLFTGGTRDWKKVEGLLRGTGLIPTGLMAVPGSACPLDSKGNIRKAALNELLGVVKANIKNLRVFRKSGAGKPQKGIGYFVVLPGDKAKLHPGIWRRIETGSSSTVKPMIMYVRPGKWKRFIDLETIGKRTVARFFEQSFNTEFAAAMRSAR